MKIGIVGASGYTGAELLRLLAGHPEAEVTYLTAHSYAGTPVTALYPHLSGYGGMLFEEFEAAKALKSADIFFVALPHGKAMEVVPLLYGRGAKVIDLSADFRLDSETEYEAWYGVAHTSPQLIGEAVYGLPELFRKDVTGASLVAVPGCYPTSVMLALSPLLARGMVSADGLIADAKSGVSGAGRSLTLSSHFAQCDESVGPYNIGGHRHTPEMRLYLSKVAGIPVSLIFAPHLIPMSRGILATCYGRLEKPVSTSELLEVYRDFYTGNDFVITLPEGALPQTKNVQGSNFCHLSVMAEHTTGMAVAIAAIDNLVKGASGAAVQCMNLMTGRPEAMGLGGLPIFP